MKILITGGLGFIGNNVVAKLLQEGKHDVRVFDIATPDNAWAYNVRDVEFQQGDLRDPAALSKAVKGAEAIIHLAAHTRVMDSIEDPRLNFETNAVATFSLLCLMRVHGVNYLINASTGGAILGDAVPPVHEEMPARPLSPYGASKLAAEGYCSAFMGTYDIQTVSLRFSNVYGLYSGLKGSAVALFSRQILDGEEVIIYGDGEQTRDFLFAGDVADGILLAMDKKATGVYQLGTGRGTTVNRMLDLLKTSAGKTFRSKVTYKPARKGEIAHNICEISKARAGFGYDPVTTLEQGMPETWQWFVNDWSPKLRNVG